MKKIYLFLALGLMPLAHAAPTGNSNPSAAKVEVESLFNPQEKGKNAKLSKLKEELSKVNTTAGKTEILLEGKEFILVSKDEYNNLEKKAAWTPKQILTVFGGGTGIFLVFVAGCAAAAKYLK